MLAVWEKIRSAVQPKYLLWIFVFCGALLRIRQYVADRSLWADEASLALNIVNRSFAGLFTPLDYDQGAPIGFLLIEKTMIVILGNKDYILRLFPLLCGLAAVYLMYRISLDHTEVFGVLSLFMFSICSPAIYYSSELKQYSADIVVTLFILYYSLRFTDGEATGRDFLGLTIAGIVALWISYPSVFVLAGVGLLLLYGRLVRKISYPLAWILAVGMSWLINLWVIFRISLQQLAVNDHLQNFWQNDFVPLPPWEHWGWFQNAYLKFLSASMGISLPLPWYIVLSYSLVILFGFLSVRGSRKRQFMTGLGVVTTILLLIASALHLYPISGRFLLFLIPFLFLLMANGLKQILDMINRWNGSLARFLVLTLILGISWRPIFLATKNLITPPLKEHIKPALAYLEENRQGNDLIYVYYGGLPAFMYYESMYNLSSADLIYGVMNQEDPQKYRDQIDTLKGQDRVWFIFTHNCDTCIVHEQRYYIQYLNKIGKTLYRFHGTGVNLYLYDLKP